MPLLRVGQHDVAHYEARWLEDVIRRAAEAAGHRQWWPAADVARGVIQFLRDRFHKNIITLHDLFGKIGQTLKGIGFADIADRIHVEPPPMELSLLEIARESERFELLFFRRLADEVFELRELGATRLHCAGMRPAVKYLLGTAARTSACADFEVEIVQFIREAVGKTNEGTPFALLLT
jgi:hypothetical protein